MPRSLEVNNTLLYIINDASFFLSHRLPIALAAVRDGYSVVVATPMSKDVRTIVDLGLNHIPLRMTRSGTSIVSELISLIHIGYIMIKIKPNIVHLVTIKPVLYGGFWSRILRTPSAVFAISGMGSLFSDTAKHKTLSKSIAELMYRFIFRHKKSAVILQNSKDLDSLREMGALRSEQAVLVNGSGVDLDVYCPSPLADGERIVVLPARMLWEKGVGIFVEAAKLLKSRGVVARMVLVGPYDPENPDAVSLSQLQEWKNEGIVEWWGHKKNMIEVYAMSHLVVLPSFYREGMPKSLLEAAACGRAIITTDLPGCRDAVDPNKSGLIVPPKDPNALAEAIEKIVNNSDILRSMGVAGRAKAIEKFNVDSVIQTHLNIYRSLGHDQYSRTID